MVYTNTVPRSVDQAPSTKHRGYFKGNLINSLNVRRFLIWTCEKLMPRLSMAQDQQTICSRNKQRWSKSLKGHATILFKTIAIGSVLPINPMAISTSSARILAMQWTFFYHLSLIHREKSWSVITKLAPQASAIVMSSPQRPHRQKSTSFHR